MRSHFFVSYLSLFLLLAHVPIATALDPFVNHHINNRGEVVWQGQSSQQGGIFLYNGETVRLLDIYTDHIGGPQLNDSGQVVWEDHLDIKLYRDTTANDINALNIFGLCPQVNANGQVVWFGGEVSIPDLIRSNPGVQEGIYLYSGSDVQELTGDRDLLGAYPQINDGGQVVWMGGVQDADTEIYLYDGSGVTRLTDNDYDDELPQIGNNGHVVWVGETDDVESGREVFLYDGATVTSLGPGTWPRINDRGHVVWMGNTDGGGYEVSFYDGSTVTRLGPGWWPQINDRDHVVWMNAEGTDSGLVYRIFLYDGTAATQIDDNADIASYPQINNDDHIIWMSGGVVYYHDGTDTFPLVYDAAQDPGNTDDEVDDGDFDDDVDIDVDDVIGSSSGACFISNL